MISSDYRDVDKLQLRAADLIVLGGGDVVRGLRIMRETGLFHDLRRRHSEGATILGVSAGAVHLGSRCLTGEDDLGYTESSAGLALVPFVIDVHEEDRQWSRLRQYVERSDPAMAGLGIPFGSGVAVHPDSSLQPLGGPVVEFDIREGRIAEHLILPAGENEE